MLKKIVWVIKKIFKKNNIRVIEACEQKRQDRDKDFIGELKELVTIKCCGEVQGPLCIGDGTGIQEEIKY